VRVKDILDSLESDRLKIVETGCAYTKDIALWVSKHPESHFTSADLNSDLQYETHSILEEYGTARYCTFLTQDHYQLLSKQTWVDAAFLHPIDLQSGLHEFLLAVSTGARVVVIKDYQSRAGWAIKRAKEIGWRFEYYDGDMNILRRPD